MDVDSKTVTRQRHGCVLNSGPSALEFSTLTTQLPSHPQDDSNTIKHKPFIITRSWAVV